MSKDDELLRRMFPLSWDDIQARRLFDQLIPKTDGRLVVTGLPRRGDWVERLLAEHASDQGEDDE